MIFKFRKNESFRLSKRPELPDGSPYGGRPTPAIQHGFGQPGQLRPSHRRLRQNVPQYAPVGPEGEGNGGGKAPSDHSGLRGIL